MIRLKDVAARAGVSLMTVSKVLRDAPDVSDATKSRIRQLAGEMGYVPDALARSLRTRKTKLLGLIVSNLAEGACGQVAAAITERLEPLGFDVLVAQTHDNRQREETCIRKLVSRRIDGLFVCPVYRLAPVAPIYDELRRSGTPTVLVGHRAPFCTMFTNVETDDASASFQMTQHLIQLGHERIAFFAGPPAAAWAQQRFDGYRRALREAEIAFDDRLVFTAGTTVATGEQAAAQMLSESTCATAVQTVSDLAAVGAAVIFERQGWKVPRDISLAGFGNDPLSQHGRLALSTVHSPNAALGSAAVEAMMRLLSGDRPQTRSLPAQVIIRASTGVPHPRRRSARQTPPNHGASFNLGDELQ